MATQILIPRCEDGDLGLVAEKGLDCRVVVKHSNGEVVEPIDYDGMSFIPCKVGDIVMYYYNEDKSTRIFKVQNIERSGHFFVCEIVYDEMELIEMELISIAEQVEAGEMTTNSAHLRADQLILSVLYSKGLKTLAEAYDRVPKYYE